MLWGGKLFVASCICSQRGGHEQVQRVSGSRVPSWRALRRPLAFGGYTGERLHVRRARHTERADHHHPRPGWAHLQIQYHRGQIHKAKPDFTKIAADVASMPAEIEQSRKALTDIAGGDHAGAQELATFTHAWWQHVGNIPVRLGDRLALGVTETMHTIKEVEYQYQY